MRDVLYLSSLFFLIVSCSHQDHVSRLREIQKKSVIHKKEYWKDYGDTPLEKRIFSPDSKMIEYLNRANKIDGFPPTVKAVELTEEEKTIFKRVIKELPQNLKSFVERTLKGVFIVDSLGSSGMTDGISSEKDSSYMVFDRKVFNKVANDWCTWKENSVFKEGNTSLKCVIRKGRDNNEKAAFQFIFMHELGHVINRGFKDYLPFWEDKTPDSFKDYPYLKISWKNKDKKIARKNEGELFSKVRFYAPVEKRQNNDSIMPTYKELQKSEFPSLYSVINAWDDFAEAFVIYHHTQVLKKPYKIIITNGKEKLVFKTCFQTGKCPQKKKLMRDFFNKKL